MNGPLQITVIGAGVMGQALAAGMLDALEPTPVVTVVDKRAEAAAAAQAGLGVQVASAGDALPSADVVVLAVKPQDFDAVLSELGPLVPDNALVISIAAGIPISTITDSIPQANVVRAMPNTPARIGAGVTGISGAPGCPPDALDWAARLLRSVGSVVEVPESLQNAVTAVSGSGPAYVFYLAEAMIQAGVGLGLTQQQAKDLTVATVVGAGQLLAQSGQDPQGLRAAVTSPGGTTAAAIAALDAAGVNAAIATAVTAARDRGSQLSGQ